LTTKNRGTLAALIRYPEKGAPGVSVNTAVLLEGRGMEGDFHASEGGRQISILSVEARQWMAAQEPPGLCFSRFRENMRLRGIPPELLRPGIRLRTGTAVLEICARPTRCNDECRFFSRKPACPLREKKLFAQVIRGGAVKTGDDIDVLPLTE
jgi:MOSC domain-containing protein YiiM